MKCGTNTLGHLIAAHPDIVLKRAQPLDQGGFGIKTGMTNAEGTVMFEIHHFTHATLNGRYNGKNIPVDPLSREAREYYARILPEHSNGWTIDKSPSYLDVHFEIFENVPNTMHQMLPNAKIVFTVCDPVGRLYSHWEHLMNRVPNNPLVQQFTLEQAIEAALDTSNITCSLCLQARHQMLEIGFYAPHIKKWKDVYGEESVMVVEMEKLSDPETTRNVLKFLELDQTKYPWDAVDFSKRHYALHPSGASERLAPQWMHDALDDVYAPYAVI